MREDLLDHSTNPKKTMPRKTIADYETEKTALVNANATLTAAATTLTTERDNARAEAVRLNGEVTNRDNTIRTVTAERDTARTGCAAVRRHRGALIAATAVLLVGIIGSLIWGFSSSSAASTAKQEAGMAQHAVSVAESAAKTAETAKAKSESEKADAERKLATAEAEKATAEAAKVAAETAKAEAERKLAAAEAAQKVAEAALAAAKATPPTPQPLVATPVVPNGNGVQIPNGEVREAKILQTNKRGAVVKAIGRPGPVNGRIVQPLFEVPGEIVVTMRHDQNLQEFVGNLSFDGIPKDAIPDPRRIQPIRTVMKDGVVYHQLGVVQ